MLPLPSVPVESALFKVKEPDRDSSLEPEVIRTDPPVPVAVPAVIPMLPPSPA